ncbi:tripartite tricarboxylate transporter substrate binding protein [Petrocella sp. FN5]|uniref:tripartite tricarboxylate transporter substrate binding protein n=1 Tax=Petrocella sp. FN5 TaxID=3032002 RepID=UPI0023DB267B|nr:tripartite tricarboxylate transporter substrate binding protein [Petrocella sp. FN5]MDF1618762.1 tripartite tricarboxylate transporter substrate binding protein [Petrocella sp. FN5]
MYNKKLWISITMTILLVVVGVTSCKNQQADQYNNQFDRSQNEDEIFPSKPIQIVVPYAPGGGTDSVARAFARTANNYFVEPIVVVNKLGQGGARGLAEGLFAKPDGYTVTLVTTEINTLAAFGIIDFNYSDIEPLMLLNSETGVVVVSKDFPFDTIDELVKYVDTTNKVFTIGSAGKGSIWNLAAGKIEEKTDIIFEDQYYDGTSIAVLDVLGGKLDIVIAGISEVIDHIENNQIKVLTVLSEERITELPEVKTFKESGYDFSMNTWRGLALPKGVDPEIRDVLLDGFTKAVQDHDFIELLAKLNLQYDYREKKTFEMFIEEDYLFYNNFKESAENIN